MSGTYGRDIREGCSHDYFNISVNMNNTDHDDNNNNNNKVTATTTAKNNM